MPSAGNPRLRSQPSGHIVRVVGGACLAFGTRMYNVLAVVICAVFLASQGVHGHVDLSVAGANTLHAGSFAPRTLLQLDGEGASSLSPGATVGLSIAVVVLVAVAGIMSGLTLGLLSLDRLDLEVLMRSGTTKEQVLARRLLPIVAHPHWVLCTLVIVNTLAGMALPLCLDRLLNAIGALLLSTTAIVVFGEIVPQAVCSRFGMSIGGRSAPVVRALMWFTAPLSWPMGKVLDYVLGSDSSLFARGQLRALVDLHRESAGMGGPLNEDEFNVILGALDLTSKVALKAMTPLDKVVMLSTHDQLDKPTLQRILDSGHSRIPVYKGTDRGAIMGLLITKELIRFVGPMNDTGAPIQVGSLPMRDLPHLPVTTPMFDLLNLFQTGHSHMALLVAASGDGPARGGGEEGSQQGEPDHQVLTPKRSFADKLRSSLKRIHLALLPEEEGEESEGENPPQRKPSPPGHQRSPRHSHDDQQHTQQQQQQQKLADTELQIPHPPHSAAEDTSHVALTIPNGVTANGTTGYAHMPASELDAALELGRQRSSERRAASADDLATLGMTGVPTSTAVMVADAVAAALADAADNSVKAGSVGAGGSEAGGSATTGGREGRRKRRKEGIMRSTPLLPHPNMVPVGIITLEDVMEELMQEEIVDETDKFVDNEKTTRVNARLLTMSLPPKLRRVLMAGQLAHTAAAATALALSSTKAEVVAKEGGAPLARSGSGNLEGDGAGGVGPRTSWPLSSAVPHPHKS